MKTIPINEIIKEKNIHCYLSNAVAQWNFDDNFVRVEGENDVFIYVDYGNLSKEVSYDILPRQKMKVIEALLSAELTDLTRKELQELDTERVYDELTGSFYYDGKMELYEFCREHEIKTERENYTEIELVGYSQGDRVTILVNEKEYKEVLWAEFDDEKMKEHLHHLFWDTPQNVAFEFKGEEYESEQYHGYYPSWKNDEHNYNKKGFINELVEVYKNDVTDLDFFKEQLEELLPCELEYKDF